MIQETATTQDKEHIRQLLEETYPANVRSGDAARYASVFTEDALWMPPNAPDFQGKSAIRDEIARRFQQFEITPSIVAEEIQIITDNFAYVTGKANATLQPKDGADTIYVSFRIMSLLRKEAGTWKMARNLWNMKP